MAVRLRISETKGPNFTEFSVRVTYGSGSVLFRRQCDKLCTSGFWMTSCFHIMQGIGQNQRRRVRMFRRVRQMAAPGAKSAVYDCILFSNFFTHVCPCNQRPVMCAWKGRLWSGVAPCSLADPMSRDYSIGCLKNYHSSIWSLGYSEFVHALSIVRYKLLHCETYHRQRSSAALL